MERTSITDLSGLFDGETLVVLGENFDGKSSGEFTLALGQSPSISDQPTFWCSDNFQLLWPTIYPRFPMGSETRIFSPVRADEPQHLHYIEYTPYPIWVMPPTDVAEWMKSSKNDECPIGFGDFSLAIGIAYRLGFSKIQERGCLGAGPESIKISEKLAETLGIQIEYASHR